MVHLDKGMYNEIMTKWSDLNAAKWRNWLIINAKLMKYVMFENILTFAKSLERW